MKIPNFPASVDFKMMGKCILRIGNSIDFFDFLAAYRGWERAPKLRSAASRSFFLSGCGRPGVSSSLMRRKIGKDRRKRSPLAVLGCVDNKSPRRSTAHQARGGEKHEPCFLPLLRTSAWRSACAFAYGGVHPRSANKKGCWQEINVNM